MFLYKNYEKLLPLLKECYEDEFCQDVFRRLEEGRLWLAISFDSKKEVLVYEAFSTCPTFHTEYIAFSIDSEGTLASLSSKERGCASPLTTAERGLFAYVSALEKSKAKDGEEGLKTFYSKLYREIEPLLTLGAKEREERKRVRSDFLSFMGEERDLAPLETLYSPSAPLELSFFLRKEERALLLSFDVLEGEKRLFSPRTLSTFFKSLSVPSCYAFGKEKIELSYSLFSEKSKKALDYLVGVYFGGNDDYYYYHGNEIPLSISSFSRFLSLYSGETISFQGTRYYISNDVEKAEVSVKEDGQVFLSPSAMALRGNMYLLSNADLLLFNEHSAILERFTFPSSKIGKIYGYFLKNPNVSSKTIGDLLVPYMDGINTSEESQSLKICLYVDINEKAELTFHTEYLVFNEKKREEDLRTNVYYASRINRFKKELLSLDVPSEGILKEEGKILAFLRADLSSLKKTAQVFLSERLSRTKVTHMGKIDIHLERNVDWLSLKVKHKDYSEEELSMILKAYQAKKRFVLLREQAILLEGKELEALSNINKEFNLDSSFENDEIPLYEAFSLKSEEGLSLCYSSFVKDFIEDIVSFEKKEIPLEEGMRERLRPYQLYGVKWLYTLYSHKMGGILADDMGLGKTLETIALLTLTSKQKPSLIVAPKSVIYNWREEAKRFAPSLDVHIISGAKDMRLDALKKMKEEKSGVYVVSYDSLRNDSSYYEGVSFDVIVLDEAQNIKNAFALRSKATKRLKASFRLALTGTPIENSMADLWAIFDYLMPGYLRSLSIFKTTYVMAGNQEEARRLLSNRIQPFLLRRTKKEVLKELPPKSVERVSIPMDEESESYYRATLQEARMKRKQSEKEKGPMNPAFGMLPLLTKLREICVDPSVFFDGFSSIGSKMEYALDLVHNAILNKHKVLVFSAFKKVLDHFSDLLLDRGIASYIIAGDTAANKRIEMAKSFNEKEDVLAMLVSLKAGGTGLNLQGADTVIHLDPWWNLASEEQATDRAYRIGQKNPVSVYKLYCHGSIEEKVLELQDSKRELYDSLIHSSSSFLSSLSKEDLDFLLD